MPIEISVVICTYNRSHLVDQVLSSLAFQQFDRARYEILVVDNNSPDDTKAVVERHTQTQSNIRYILETRQGHSHARNRGWVEGKGEYIAYLDDDCKVPETWLAKLSAIIAERAPAVCGGPALAFYDRPKPAWFRDEYGSFDLGGEARALDRHYVYGMNVTFKRDLLEAIDGFNPAFGMVGGAIGYGDEIYPQRRLRALFPEAEIYYDPQLFVYHLVRPEKMTIPWTIRQRFANGAFAFRLFFGEAAATITHGQLIRRALLASALLVRDVVVRLPLRNRQKYPYPQQFLVERAFQQIEKLGSLFEQFRQIERRQIAQRGARQAKA